MDVKKIYKKLLAHFGPQGWWPIFDKKTQKCVYSDCRKLNSLQSFEICVGAILTQNTAWKNVERALANLINSLPLWKRGIEGDLCPQFILSCRNLEKLIQPAGYYNQKTKKLRIFSKWWLSHSVIPATCPATCPAKPKGRSGKLKERSGKAGIQAFRSELLSLWGIGPETADSMLLYAFGQPIFVIDAYTKRLCKEYGVEFKTYDEYRQFFESQLAPPISGAAKSSKLFNEYHALIVAWGKLHAKNREAAVNIIK